MDSVYRGLVIYFLLLLIFRVAGRRTLSEMTTFDLILLLLISETAQQAMINDDQSIVNAALLIITLVLTNIGLSMLKLRMPNVEKWLDGRPVVIIADGEMLMDRMDKARIDEGDIMESARQSQGLERIDQIRYAVLERDGKISIIPKQ